MDLLRTLEHCVKNICNIIIIIIIIQRIGSQSMLNTYVRHTPHHTHPTPNKSNATSSPTYIRVYPPTHNHHPTPISIRRKLAPQPTHLFPHLQLLLVSTPTHRCTNHIHPQTKYKQYMGIQRKCIIRPAKYPSHSL